MATLLKQDNWYYSQFYSKQRSPKRKRIALKTKTKRVAQKLHQELEDKYAQDKYDPWTGYDSTKPTIPLSKNSSLKEALDYYITQKSQEDWRSTTIRNTSYVLRAFGRFVGLNKCIQELTPEKINNFLNRDKYAYATKKTHRKKIEPFARWCKKQKLISYDFDKIKIYNNDDEQTENISYLSEEEIKTLKEVIAEKVSNDIEKGYQNADRNANWLLDFIDWQRYSGMRISETLSLTPENINTDTWEVTIGSDTFNTKSKAKQILPIGEVKPLKELAEKLLENCSKGERLFKHKDRRRTSRTFKKYVRLALPEREDICVHSLRHTCCIHLLRNGVPIYTVQRWMRHASVSTTQNYADLLNMDISTQVGEAIN